MSRTSSPHSTPQDAGNELAISDTMRRFSLRPRKTSNRSSSYAASSSNESKSTSYSAGSRASHSSSKTSLSSLSSRLRRSKKSYTQENTSTVHTQPSTVSKLLNLPPEILADVLLHLSTRDILSLRLVSRTTLHALQNNNPCPSYCSSVHHTTEPSLVYIQKLAATCTCLHSHLYPPQHNTLDRDAYFLRYLRRERVYRAQMRVLLSFLQTRVYMLKLNMRLECPHFGPYRDGLEDLLSVPLRLAHHYLETIRHLVVHVHPSHRHQQQQQGATSLDHCQLCLTSLRHTVSSYPPTHLVATNHVLTVLIAHMVSATRTPSHVSPIERKLRKWGTGPPGESQMRQFIILGGPETLKEIDEMKGSYSKRLFTLKSFTNTIEEAVKVNGLAFDNIYGSGRADPTMEQTMHSSNSHPEFGSSTQIHTASIVRDRQQQIEQSGASYYPANTSIPHSFDVPLSLLTQSTIDSLPPLSFLSGPDSLIGQAILETQPPPIPKPNQLLTAEEVLLGSNPNLLDGGTDPDHEVEIQEKHDLAKPYAWLQRVMASCFRPRDPWAVAQNEASAGQERPDLVGMDEERERERERDGNSDRESLA